MLRIKSIGSKRSINVSSSNNFPNPLIHLGVNHESTSNIASNDTTSSTTNHISRIPSIRDSYFSSHQSTSDIPIKKVEGDHGKV